MPKSRRQAPSLKTELEKYLYEQHDWVPTVELRRRFGCKATLGVYLRKLWYAEKIDVEGKIGQRRVRWIEQDDRRGLPGTDHAFVLGAQGVEHDGIPPDVSGRRDVANAVLEGRTI